MYAWRLQFFKNWWDDFSKSWYYHHFLPWQLTLLTTGLFLIVIDLVGLCVPLIIQSAGIFDARVFTVLKVLKIVKGLRALRVIRTIRYECMVGVSTNRSWTLLPSFRFLKNLNVIVLTLLESIPAIGAIVITISLVLCKLRVIVIRRKINSVYSVKRYFCCHWPRFVWRGRSW